MKLISWQKHLEQRFPAICNDIRCGAYAPEGWQPQIEICLQHMTTLGEMFGATIRVEQIKTKFGGLRLYFSIRDQENLETDYTLLRECLDGLVGRTEAKVSYQCMECGEYAPPAEGWAKTLCKQHKPVDTPK